MLAIARYCPPRPAARAPGGFTLVEVLVVIAILGIIAAIGYPAYQGQVLKSYRAAAKACVMEHAQFMERRYTTALSYGSDADGQPGIGCRTEGNLNERYTITISNRTQGTYTVTAAPTGPQARDTQCGSLSVNQAGQRSITGSSSVSACW